ncbi:MAG: MerR family transcriptional regulator [Bacteroidia bacterium]
MIDPKLLDLAREFQEKYIAEKAFSLTDTGVTHRLITYWDQKELLLESNENKKWRKFNFEELIWIRMIARLRQLNIGVETIKVIKSELFQKISVADLMTHPNYKQTVENFVAEEQDADLLRNAFNNPSEKIIEGTTSTIFQMLLKSTYIEKKNYSILIALKLSDSGNQDATTIGMSIYSPEILEDLAKTKGYFEIFSKTFISISLSELIQDGIININPAKLPPNLVFLSDAEQKILQAIRSGDYKTVTVRFNDKSEPSILEVSQIKKIKIESRLYEIIHKGEYQDIEIKAQNGEIYHCKNTKKIKLK